MNLMKNSKSVWQKSKWLSVTAEKATNPFSERVCKKKIHFSRPDLQKPLPPIVKNDLGQEETMPIKPEKLQRDIFGATILPPNLSFENSKRLTDNQVRLEDIPLVDENDAAEEIAAQKMRSLKGMIPKEANQPKKEVEIVVVNSHTLDDSSDLTKSPAELFWVADSYENIPGPKIFGNIFGGLKQLIRQVTVVSLFRVFKNNTLAPFRMYGPIIKLPEFLGGRIVLISRLEHIATVLEQDQSYPISSILESVQKSRLIQNNKYIKYHLKETEWEDVRKTFSEPLTKGVERYFEDIDECCSKFVRRIKIIRNRQHEVPEEFLFELNKWSLECLCFLVFDKSFGFVEYESTLWPSKTSQLLYSLTLATKNLCQLESGFQLWRFIKTKKLSSLGVTCDILESIIAEHVAQVQVNLLKKKEEGRLGRLGSVSLLEGFLLRDVLSPDEVVTTVLDTLLIGMNAMSSSLGFLLYYLSQNPRSQAEVWKEVKHILPEKYNRLEYRQLTSLNYLKACVKETFRLKMPIPVLTRILSKNVTISNYQVPKGTFMLMAAQAEGIKEENFEDPMKFLPERWLENENSQTFGIPLGNYMQDSLEKELAETSVLVAAALIIRSFSVEYLYGDLGSTNTVLCFPTKPLKFTFTDRTN